MALLNGKTALIFGVASDTSIAWFIAEKMAAAGAKIILGYQFKFRSRVMQLVKDKPWVAGWYPCDLTKEEEVTGFFQNLDGKADILVHAVAYADASTFRKPTVMCTDKEFGDAMNISAFSLLRLTKCSLPHLNDGASIMTLSYLGAVRTVPSYQIMGIAKAALECVVREIANTVGARGIRCNAISAGPIRTLAAAAIPGFDHILDHVEAASPLRQNITQEDVAGAALFLGSDLSQRITAQTLYVDSGYSSIGVPPLS
ncbi:MAG TPA: enoyl-ACP reductase [Myxococcales bacterium]|nr:enoyl-ACP reductase [Myxococcales bacterium]